jgi:tetratricopeptide (TPR) repeat protein
MIKKCRKIIEKGEAKYRENIKNGDFEKAMEFAKQAIEMCPDNFEGYLYLGIAYHGIGDLEKALENLKKAEELINNENKLGIIYRHNKLAAIYKHIGEVLIDMGKTNDALTYLNKSIDSTKQIDTDTVYTLSKIANIYYKKRDLKKSAEYYKEAFEIGKEYASKEFIINTINNLSVILFELGYYEPGYYEDAIEIFEDLLSYGSINNDPFIICLSEINLGSAYLMVGNKTAAKRYFTLGLHHAKESGNKKFESIAYMYLGDILNNEKYLEKAKELFKEYINSRN